MRWAPARLLPILAVAACLLLPATGNVAPATNMPSSHTQPLLDGCQRSQSLILGGATPEWVYVDAASVRAARALGNQKAGRRTAEGTVVQSRPAGEDIYLSHTLHDYNVMVRPDAPYGGLLATGNLVPGDEQGQIEGEWETRAIPTWAWSEPGDHVRISGNWIWDCGHWGNSAADPTGLSQLLVGDPVETVRDLLDPGAIRGETTELHPIYELATTRKDAAGILTGQTGGTALSRLDVWISGDGTPAESLEDCALLGVTIWIPARVLCPSEHDVGGTYRYTLPLRPKPSPSSQIIVNPVIRRAETSANLSSLPVAVTPNVAAGTVTVSFRLPHRRAVQRFGITVEAGWSGDEAAVLHHVSLNSVHIFGSLDGAGEPNLNPAGVPGERTPDPGDWVLFASVSGRWLRLPLYGVTSGQDIPLGTTFDFWLPAGVTPTLFVSGHECDEPLMDCLREGYGGVARPLEFTELGFNDRPGRITLNHRGVPLSPGNAVYGPAVNPFPNGTSEDLSDNICGPNGCYQISATWTEG